jgi:hypothetical protein
MRMAYSRDAPRHGRQDLKMPNPSKRYPFVIEFQAYGKWYAMDAFRDKAEAEAMLPVIQKRAPDAVLRLRDIRAAQ